MVDDVDKASLQPGSCEKLANLNLTYLQWDVNDLFGTRQDRKFNFIHKDQCHIKVIDRNQKSVLQSWDIL